MEGGGVYSGGGGLGLTLGDIGKSSEAGDFVAIGNASFFVVVLSALVARIANVGGLSLNTLYDAYGLELVLSQTATLMLIFQLTRFLYTAVWGAYGKRWSPLVFMAMLLTLQTVGCVAAYYALIQPLPAGKNEFVDLLKAHVKENGPWRPMIAHGVLALLAAFVAMVLLESSDLVQVLLPTVLIATLPLILSISYAKPAPPPPPPKKKEEMRDMRDMQQIRGFY